MNKEQALVTIEFLKRVDLKGVEVPAYVQVLNSLTEMTKDKEENADISTD